MNAILQTDVELVSNEMQVQFREFNLWSVGGWSSAQFPLIWKSGMSRRCSTWFYLGKLGNAENLQIQEEGLDISYMNYDEPRADNSLMALMHNMSDFEYERTLVWLRNEWCDRPRYFD